MAISKSICQTKVRSINDLSVDEQKSYITEYINENAGVISKNLGWLMPTKLKQNFIGSSLLKVHAIKSHARFMIRSNLSFSENPLEIPSNLHIIGEIILEKDFSQKGIFRINSTRARVRAAKTLLYDIMEKRIEIEKGKELFHKNFDLIDAAETYKQLLRGFNSTIISESYIPIILKIEKILDPEEKMICTRALIYSLPFLNRKILENHIYICYSIIEKIQSQGHPDEQMDIAGISSVMMPNIILKSKQNIAISEVLILVPFTKYLFLEFKNLIKVSEN